MSTVTDSTTATSSASTTTSSSNTTSVVASEDRFLKLLVAQMKNQDPLNPTDNAQVTSQMAQINTVTGIDKLNTALQGLNTQFLQMQALQGVSLVGRAVVVPGDRVAIANSVGTGQFELAGDATSVKVQMLNGAGRVVDTVDMGALKAGAHDFAWKAGSAEDGENYRYKVVATRGTTAVASTAYMSDVVQSVSTAGSSLQLELRHSGNVGYGQIKTLN